MTEIKQGDLVAVIHDCCGRFVGRVGVVKKIGIPWNHGTIFFCGRCNKDSNPMEPHAIVCGDALPFSWLRKIKPPAQESERETVVPWNECGWQPEKVRV